MLLDAYNSLYTLIVAAPQWQMQTEDMNRSCTRLTEWCSCWLSALPTLAKPPEGLPPCVPAQQQPEQIADQTQKQKQLLVFSVQQPQHHLGVDIAKHTVEPHLHRHYSALELLLHLALAAAITNNTSK